MAKERTLSIVKPSAVAANHIGGILEKLEQAGLEIVAAKMVHLSRDQAEEFYSVHRERPFFRELYVAGAGTTIRSDYVVRIERRPTSSGTRTILASRRVSGTIRR